MPSLSHEAPAQGGKAGIANVVTATAKRPNGFVSLVAMGRQEQEMRQQVAAQLRRCPNRSGPSKRQKLAVMTMRPDRSTVSESDEEEARDDLAVEEPAAPDATYARLEQEQTQSQLVHFVERLPASERRIVFTHYFQRHTFEEIARDMGLTKGRVSQLHHSALKRMREWGSAKDLPQPD